MTRYRQENRACSDFEPTKDSILPLQVNWTKFSLHRNKTTRYREFIVFPIMIYLRNRHLCTLFHQGEWYVSRHGWMRPFFAMNIEPLHVEIFFCLVNFQSVRMCAFRCNRTKIFFSDIWRINVSHTFIYIQACAHYFFLFLCAGNIYGLRPLIQVYGFLGWRNKHWGKIHTVSEFNCLFKSLFALHFRLISTWNYNIILTGSLGQYWWYSMKRTQL